MEKDYLILKRGLASRSSGERNDDDYDVLANDLFHNPLIAPPSKGARVIEDSRRLRLA